MNAQEIIEAILEDLKLSPNEFASNIGASTSVVHNLVTGVTSKITSGTARKICDAYSQYNYSDLVNMKNPIRTNKNRIETLTQTLNLKQKAVETVEMWEDLKSELIFRNRLDQEVMKKLLLFQENPEELKKWLQ